MRFEGFNESLPPEAELLPPAEAGTFDGQIAEGDILRVSRTSEGDFIDAVTVRPGAVVTVGMRLSNPGPGPVGEVLAWIDLPDRASNALEIELRVSWNGITGPDETTDTATIFVAPSQARACARYVPQSSETRQGDRERQPLNLDWIVSDGGASFDQFEAGISETRFLYFEVVII